MVTGCLPLFGLGGLEYSGAKAGITFSILANGWTPLDSAALVCQFVEVRFYHYIYIYIYIYIYVDHFVYVVPGTSTNMRQASLLDNIFGFGMPS